MTVTRRSRFRGALLGLAAGDALGTTLEFQQPGTFTPITDMVGGGTFRLQPGQWTDDTSLALCLAESLIEQRRFDPVDQLRRYTLWRRDGYLSSTGACFDIGRTTRRAIEQFARTGEPYPGSTDPSDAGNGSIMRLAPVPMCFVNHPEAAIHFAAESSRTTHGTIEAVDACRYFGALLFGALNGTDKDTLLSERFTPAERSWSQMALASRIDEIANGSFKRREPPQIVGSGYVVRSLEAALWAFFKTDTFRDGCLAAVNLGNDADTTGAVYGQLAGAYYGDDAIPAEWKSTLAKRDLIVQYADALLDLSETIVIDGD